MNKQSGSVLPIITVILVVVIIGLLGFILWQNFMREETPDTNDSTAITEPESNVQRYSNQTIGYTIEVPSDWYLTEPQNGEESPRISNLTLDEAGKVGGGFVDEYIDISIFKQTDEASFSAMAQGMTFAEFYEALGQDDVNGGAATYDKESVKAMTVNGLQAKSTKSSFTQVNESIFILQDDGLLEITLYPYGVSSDETVARILDSFTLL